MFGKIGAFWNTLREINLEAIRKEAQTSFPLLVLADGAGERAAMTRLLNGDGTTPNPWLHTAAPDQAEALLATNPARLALLVSPTAELSRFLENARSLLVSRRVPTVTVVIGGSGLLGSFARGGEKKRIVLPSLQEEQREAFATALFDVVRGDARLSLARQFEGLREPLFAQLIGQTARANASYSFTTGLAETVPLLDVPLNVGDLVVLTKNQLIMAYRIALAAGRDGRPRDVLGELVGVMGAGLLARQVARELIGLIPVAGIVPKVVVAYTGTWAIGHAAAAWATGNGEITRQSIEKWYAAGLGRGRAVARQLAASRKAHEAA